MIDELFDAISAGVTRGKALMARVAGRTLVQVAGLANETASDVELLLPPGYVALPASGADVLLVQVLGQRDHLVAIGGDMVGETLALAAGERGIVGPGAVSHILFKADGTVVVADKAGTTLTLDGAGNVRIGGALVVTGDVVAGSGAANISLLAHVHGGVTPGGADTAGPAG